MWLIILEAGDLAAEPVAGIGAKVNWGAAQTAGAGVGLSDKGIGVENKQLRKEPPELRQYNWVCVEAQRPV